MEGGNRRERKKVCARVEEPDASAGLLAGKHCERKNTHSAMANGATAHGSTPQRQPAAIRTAAHAGSLLEEI